MNDLTPTLKIDAAVIALIATFLGVMGKIVWDIIWDWAQSGRVTDEYLKKSDCLKRQEKCGINILKRDFYSHRENDGKHDADSDSRLRMVEEKTAEGKIDFLAFQKESRENYTNIQKSINSINLSLKQITTILEERFGRKFNGVTTNTSKE